MNPTKLPLGIGLLLLFAALPALAGPPINIRTEKGGKLLLVVDDETLRTAPGANPVLYIDSDNHKVLTQKGGNPLFAIPGDIIFAHVYDGPVVAYVDGRQLKNKPGGSPIFYVDGPIIRKPDKYGDPAYYVDGPVMTNTQLIAVLYTLKPDLFTVPKDTAAPAAPAPAAEAPAAPAAQAATPAPAAPSAPAAKDFTGGTYSVTSFKSSDGSNRSGKITIHKQGDIFAIDLQLTGGAPQQGVATFENGELHAAIGTPNTVGLAVYNIDNGALTGTWLNITGGSSGSENLTGAKDIGGAYTITAAKAPFTGAPYAGTLTIDPIAGANLNSDAQIYHFAWDLGGGYKVQGIGFKAGTTLVAATSTTGEVATARFKIDPATGALTGDSYSVNKVTASYSLKRDGD